MVLTGWTAGGREDACTTARSAKCMHMHRDVQGRMSVSAALWIGRQVIPPSLNAPRSLSWNWFRICGHTLSPATNTCESNRTCNFLSWRLIYKWLKVSNGFKKFFIFIYFLILNTWGSHLVWYLGCIIFFFWILLVPFFLPCFNLTAASRPDRRNDYPQPVTLPPLSWGALSV